MTPLRRRFCLPSVSRTLLLGALCATPLVAQDASADVTQGQGVATNNSCKEPVLFGVHGSGSMRGPVTLVPILYGFSEADPYYHQLAAELDRAYSAFEESAYYGWLRMEYFAPVINHTSPIPYNRYIPTNPASAQDIKNAIGDAISTNSIPTPSQALYVIHLPPGFTDDVMGPNCSAALGHNGTYLSSSLNQFYWVILPDPQTCGTNFTGMTISLSHEIAERVTDPGYDGNVFDGSGNGWVDTTQPAKCGVQIGDLCNREEADVMTPKGPYAFQKLWSNAMGECVDYDVQWFAPGHIFNPPGQYVFKPGGGVAAVAESDYFHTYTIGYDGKLWSAGGWEGSPFDSGPVPQPPSPYTFAPGGGLAALVPFPEALDTYTIGNDGKLWSAGNFLTQVDQDTGESTQVWSPAQPVPAQNQTVFMAGGGIAAVKRNPNVLDTFAIGFDQHLWDAGWWDQAGGWHAPYEVAKNQFVFVPGGGVAAVREDDSTIDVLTIGYDGNLWSAGRWATDHWIPAYSLLALPKGSFAPGSQLGAVVRQPGNLVDVMIVDSTGKIWDLEGVFDASNGNSWTNWSPLPTASTSVVLQGSGGIAVAARQVAGVQVLLNTVAIGFDSKPWGNFLGPLR
jgi:hypothetical protein